MSTNNSKSESSLSASKVVVVGPSRPTYDFCAVLGVLYALFDRRIYVAFEDDDGLERLRAHDLLLDLRGYTSREGSRVYRALYALGLDYFLIEEYAPERRGGEPRVNPRYNLPLDRLVYDLATNNGAVQDHRFRGGWLKKLPLSLPRMTREMWNLLDWYADPSDRDLRVDLVDMLATASEVELLETHRRWRGKERVVEEKTEQLMRQLLGPGGKFHQADKPDGWWRCDHPLSVDGLARNMIRVGREKEAGELVADFLKLNQHLGATEPSFEDAKKCITDEFPLVAVDGGLARMIESHDTRIARRLWGGGRSGLRPAQVLVVHDTRYQSWTIMSQPGAQLGELQAWVDRFDPGVWALGLKHRNKSGDITPILFGGGGASRQLTAPTVKPHILRNQVSRLVRFGDPRKPDGVPWQEEPIRRLRPRQDVERHLPRAVKTVQVVTAAMPQTAATVLADAFARAGLKPHALDAYDPPDAEALEAAEETAASSESAPAAEEARAPSTREELLGEE